MNSAYFTVYVEDNQTHETVQILDLATRSEASELSRVIGKYCGCKVYIIESEFYYRKGKHE